MKNEFYDAALRKKIYNSLEELQRDADIWLLCYNNNRPHSGKYCYGKTPMQTFVDAKHIAVEKSNAIVCNEDTSDSHVQLGNTVCQI
jgi:hypothetical protein